MIYPEAINYLNSFVNFERQPDVQFNTRDEDLTRFRKLLARLGDPQSRFPVIHIVGTKGKGSTGALIASILSQAGYKVGLYTSPHLVTVRERIRVGRQIITKRAFARLMTIIRDLPDDVRTGNHQAFRTVFEHLTALALMEFAHQSVDIALLEAGLGGKLDATVVIDPLLTIITPIGLDHQAILGDTIAEIAADKAHAIKPDVPAITAPQEPEAMGEIVKRSDRLNAPLFIAPGSIEFGVDNLGISFSKVRSSREWLEKHKLRIGLAGDFQLENASVALSVVEFLRTCDATPTTSCNMKITPTTSPLSSPAIAAGGEVKGCFQGKAGFAISNEAVKRGLNRVRWQGRLQVLSNTPVPVILDGAHNAMAVQVVVESLRKVIPGKTFRVVFAAMKNKPAERMLRSLQDSCAAFYLAPLQFPKSLDSSLLKELSSGMQIPSRVYNNVPEAYHQALMEIKPDEALLVIGSLYLVGEVLRHLRNLPPPVPDGQIDPRF